MQFKYQMVVVWPTSVQWFPTNLNTQCKIIKCVFTCCAWLGRSETNTDHTPTHCKYLSSSAGSACINDEWVLVSSHKKDFIHITKLAVSQWVNIHMLCCANLFMEYYGYTLRALHRTLLPVISPSSFHCLFCSRPCFSYQPLCMFDYSALHWSANPIRD